MNRLPEVNRNVGRRTIIHFRFWIVELVIVVLVVIESVLLSSQINEAFEDFGVGIGIGIAVAIDPPQLGRCNGIAKEHDPIAIPIPTPTPTSVAAMLLQEICETCGFEVR